MLKSSSRAALLASVSAAVLLLAAHAPAQAIYWDIETELSGWFTQPEGSLDSGNGDVDVESALDWDNDLVGQIGLRWTPGWEWLPGIGYRLTELYAESEAIASEDFILLGGGSPIYVDGALVGAIGVAGGHYSKDEACAQAALEALEQAT